MLDTVLTPKVCHFSGSISVDGTSTFVKQGSNNQKHSNFHIESHPFILLTDLKYLFMDFGVQQLLREKSTKFQLPPSLEYLYIEAVLDDLEVSSIVLLYYLLL